MSPGQCVIDPAGLQSCIVIGQVWIQHGQRIILDTDIRVYMMIIQGSLEFDRKDIHLDANYIFVFGGAFVVGTETEPFLHKAVITLYGSPISQEIPVYGAKVLGCRFCTLDLHGIPLLDGRTHTKLGRTARAGEYELWLRERVSWCATDKPANDQLCQIGLSSTNRNATHWDYETNAIAAVTHGGYRLVLVAPLQFDHLGETRYVAGGHSIDFRANVAILSSNVVVQGETTFSRLDRHGAHIFLHSRLHDNIADQSKGNTLVARIENAEIRYAGQFGRLGRYPIHCNGPRTEPGAFATATCPPLCSDGSHLSPVSTSPHDRQGERVVRAQEPHPPLVPSLHLDPRRALPALHRQRLLRALGGGRLHGGRR